MEIDCLIKKRYGFLTQVGQNLEWIARDGADPLVLPLADVQGMQATPPTAAKLRIKLSPKEGAPWMLEFISADDLEKGRNELQAVIKKYRDSVESSASASGNPVANPNTGPAAAPNTGSSSVPANSNSVTQSAHPSSSSAKPVSSAAPKPTPAAGAAKKVKKLSLDPAKLVLNLDLQRAVLRQDPELMRIFEQTVIKSRALSNEQFWAPRTHLLVTAAQQQIQQPGSYNVLSTIKPTTSSDNRVNINLTREKIADLFDQYPLVRRAYNENVPKLSEGEFWQRFFMSRLFLVLRGEKFSATHTTDAILDPYIAVLHDLQEKQRLRQQTEDSEHPAPLFVNIEANSVNNPETYGNNILTTAGGSTRSLIRSMNGLSQKLLRGKRKLRETELDTEHNIGTMHEELQLRDLESTSTKEDGVELQIDHFGTKPDSAQSRSASNEHCFGTIFNQMPSTVNLVELVDLGAQTGIRHAYETVKELTPQTDTVDSTMLGVSADVALVHTTTTEFLKQFWYAHVNGRFAEAQQLRPYLENSLKRIDAVNGLPALQSVADSLIAALRASN